MDIPPNQTLYIKNINDKVKKDVLKRQLYLAFSPYGRIIDVVACRGDHLRGQAWLVYDDVGSATTALRSMQGFPFYNKPLRIVFAKAKSDAVALKEGSFEPRAKRQKREQAQAARAKAVAEKAAGGPTENGVAAKGVVGGGTTATGLLAVAAIGEVSTVLMAQELPGEVTEEMLKVLFGRFGGFQEIRMAAQRGIAFIEFRDELSARTAFQAYNGFKLSPKDTLQLTYAKR